MYFQSNNQIRWVDDAQTPFIQFNIFKNQPIIHGFSTKLGGVSKGDCATMNLSFTRGDDVTDVQTNHCRFAKAVGYKTDQLVLTDQVHGTNILRVGKADTGDIFKATRRIRETDGLVTNEPGVMLMTFFADCVPLLFVDPVKKAVGNAHSGWRGTVARMGEKMVRRMTDEFGSCPEDLLAVVGPSICQACYEVSEDVIREFQRTFDESVWDQLYYKKENGHYQLDLWRANEIILQEAGLLSEHICVSGLCTNDHHDLLFSHRYTGGKRGNLAAVIGLANEKEQGIERK